MAAKFWGAFAGSVVSGVLLYLLFRPRDTTRDGTKVVSVAGLRG